VRGVPYVTLARMGVNLAIDVTIGAIPFLGDAFDIAWKANRRNYKLLVRHIEQPRRHTWKDWLFLRPCRDSRNLYRAAAGARLDARLALPSHGTPAY
jgi:hypothetical protein